jgi:hypothetical protein
VLRVLWRAMTVPWYSFWLNVKTGLWGLFCTYLLTGWGCLIMLAGWEFGWLNSFHKGYEQAFTGALFSLAGVFLFIAAMFYVPMAQVHQAVTGDPRAFFDFRFVWRLVRARPTGYVLLAALIAFLSLVMEILKTAPAFLDGFDPTWTDASDAELKLMLYNYLGTCAYVLFVFLLLVRLVGAVVYRSAVLKVLRRGEVTRDELHPALREWLDRLGLDVVPRARTPGIGRVVLRGGGWTYRVGLYGTLFVIWFAFVSTFYLTEFLNYHPVEGFMNRVLVHFPCVDWMPGHLDP